jgi:FkbM family methyltransferase
MHTEHNDRWNKDNGNLNLVANYPLTEDSWVIELGGYKGEWTNRIVGNYKSNILVVEPIKEFCQSIIESQGTNPKVIVENNGISTEERVTQLSFNGDASSEYIEQTNEKRDITCYTLDYYMSKYNIDKVDLMQVNIEGEEYPLFEQWINSDILKKIQYIQIQFHRVGDNYEERRQNIHRGMENLGFELRWDYDYVFESWKNKNWV